MRFTLWGPVALAALAIASPARAELTARQLVAKAEQHTRGKTLQGEMTMIVESDSMKRTLRLKLWTSGKEHALVKILDPAKDRDTGNLRNGLELWQYLPKIDQLVRIPPSMMLQSWMGSDFTNDDLVKTSSLERDYTQKIDGKEKLGSFNTIRIVCTPLPTAPVVWGKVILWVRASDAVPVKNEFYTENGKLLKTLEGSDFKTFGSHTIPTTLVMKNTKKPGSRTVMHYDKVVYDAPIDSAVFTQQNLRRSARAN